MTTAHPEAGPELVCPTCRTGLSASDSRYVCMVCDRSFPVLCGIPDFRLFPDRYLPLDEERAKAQRLFDYGRKSTFAELVAFYYEITDDVPPALAGRFARYVHDAPRRLKRIIDLIAPERCDGVLLDAGCGSGGALVAAEGRFATCVGVDVGLRWLVIAQKRLEETGVRATLVCANVESLPFADGSFSHVLAEDLVEHCADPAAAVGALAQQVGRGGTLWVSAINRYWPGPHPAVGIWAAGLMPKSVRGRIARVLRGVDSFRNVEMVSAAGLSGAARQNGLRRTGAWGRRFEPDREAPVSMPRRLVLRGYNAFASARGSRAILVWLGPAFEMVFSRRADKDGT